MASAKEVKMRSFLHGGPVETDLPKLPQEGDGSYLVGKAGESECCGKQKKRRNKRRSKEKKDGKTGDEAQPEQEDGEYEGESEEGGAELPSYVTRDANGGLTSLPRVAGGAVQALGAGTMVSRVLPILSPTRSFHGDPQLQQKYKNNTNKNNTDKNNTNKNNTNSQDQSVAICSYRHILDKRGSNMPSTDMKRSAIPPHLRKRQQKAAAAENGNIVHAVAEPAPSNLVRTESKSTPVSNVLVAYSASDSNSSPRKATTTPATTTLNAFSSAKKEVKIRPAESKAPSGTYREEPEARIGRRQRRNPRWPTAAEQRPEPKRSEINWSSSCADSAAADTGQDGNRPRRPSVDSQGYLLTDYAGKWAPAPVDWDARPAFRDKQSVKQIEDWMRKIDEEMRRVCNVGIAMHDQAVQNKLYYFASPEAAAPAYVSQELQGDACPKYWTGPTMGCVAPQTFWQDLVSTAYPSPLDDHDLDEAKPYWECYPSPQCHFLIPHVHPHIAGIDPDENSEERLARENDNGSMHHAKNRRETERAKMQAKRDKRKKAADIIAQRTASGSGMKSPHKPALNIYVRSATAADMTLVQEIYNHYVDNTVSTPERSRRSFADILDRFTDIKANKLPYLVACERNPMSKQEKKRFMHKHGDAMAFPDRIIGFSYADDYNDMRGMYRFTAELEVYVRKDCLMKGVAKCLFDKIMALLDPLYTEKGGFDIVGDDLMGMGPSRVIKNIIVNVPYDAAVPSKLEWVTRSLGAEWLAFTRVGHLEGVGNKDGKVVNLAIFQRTTGATLDPENPPITMTA